ncbi:MAG: class II glutamine amidotransferase [Myxococcales bacterium]|nr:class II glutamine amidotransferase [Myxococcales bacterium]
MTQLLALSVEAAVSPAFRLRAIAEEDTGLEHPFGWGVAWYPSAGSAAMVVKDPTSIGKNALTNVLSDWERFASSIFVAHLRGAAKRTQIQDTHPFSRTYRRRDWVLAHNGDLRHEFRDALPLGDDPVYEPIGKTDSEHVFCWILEQARRAGVRALADVSRAMWTEWLGTINALGTLNLVLTDGVDVLAYSDAFGYRPLWYTRRRPPNPPLRYAGPEVEIELGADADMYRTAIVVSTAQLSDEGWVPLAPGSALVARRGALRWCERVTERDADIVAATPAAPTARRAARSTPATAPEVVEPRPEVGAAQPAARATVRAASAAETRDVATVAAHASAATPETRRRSEATPAQVAATSGVSARVLEGVASTLNAPEIRDAAIAREEGEDFGSRHFASRVLETIHETVYTYEEAVKRSDHLLRLRPVVDDDAELLEYSLEITPASGVTREYADVFGNSAVELQVREAYTEWRVRARSVVRLRGSAHPRLRSLYDRQRLPLVWMPWQRQMMMPYLLPPELPESQLRELSAHAMGFAERQDGDLVETLKDINRTIYEDCEYAPASTSLETTPFDVYVTRRGVCQDFSNLFIALCRLLDIPARYRVGYIFTGGKYENARQGDASHAWVEVYIPLVGWRGFDPTNGCLVSTDHVRVACGRNYRDATPTSGTLYDGGGGEKLRVSVKMFDRTSDYSNERRSVKR